MSRGVNGMICSGENPVLRVEGVEHMVWKAGLFSVAPREHSAIAFRIRGTARISTDSGVYPVRSNDILYLPQGLAYTAAYSDTEMLVIHFVTGTTDPLPEIYTLEDSSDVYKLFLKAWQLWEEKEPGYHVYVLSVLYRILGTLLERKTKSTLPPHFLGAVAQLNGMYTHSDLSIADICKAAGIGQTTFRQLFRQVYRKTPMDYVLDLRLDRARNLIAGGALVETAALESGFNDPKYFARVVKKRLGCTPRSLRTFGK